MLTEGLSQKYFNNALTFMHQKRSNSLFNASWSLINGSNLTISSLGQHKTGSAHVKHKIKSVDRLVGNKKLHGEIGLTYKTFFAPLLSSAKTLFILVDWSGCCSNKLFMLKASLVYQGRSITIYNEIHSLKTRGSHAVHKAFLRAL